MLTRDLDSFITAEKAIALQGALNNIGPDGSAVPGAGAGYVVASPSTVNPNCQFRAKAVPKSHNGKLTWTRLLHLES